VQRIADEPSNLRLVLDEKHRDHMVMHG
jgi:hypothetical protein